MSRPMIYKVCVVPDDDKPLLQSESFTIEDQNGNYMGDASDLRDALLNASEICEAHGVEKIEIMLKRG